ncbi:MAG: sugar MFS transporter [Flavobacteriales bacterium]|nr:sugar MFS transporter [Flavobacteriales bacterium]
MGHQRHSSSAVVILGALFFLFGFVTWLNGTLIPYLKIACELTTGQALWIPVAFYLSYFVLALPSAYILGRTGLKRGMTIGLLVMALGALLFLPAAGARSYPMFLTGLFIMGTGLALLQTAINPYVTVVGPIESAAARISIMGICNKVAGVLAPIILSSVILADADAMTADLAAMDAASRSLRLGELASRVELPYILMAITLVALGLLVRFSPLPELQVEKEDPPGHGSVLSHPRLVFGVFALFLYVGVEVMAGDTIGLYGESLGVPLSNAKYFTSLTLIAMVFGYLLGNFSIPRFISQSGALAISAVVGVAFTGVAATIPPSITVSIPFVDLVRMETITLTVPLTVVFIALLGLANAMVWPAIWPLAIGGLGRHTRMGSALLIMAIVGGAVLPKVYGGLAESTLGYQQAYWMMAPCYLFMLWYAFKGSRMVRWSA